jgi:hypothetical protein
MATLEWVDWYNNRRLFEALGDIPPAEAESAYYATMPPSESPRMAEQTSTDRGGSTRCLK